MKYLILLFFVVAEATFAQQPTPEFLGAALRYQEQICPMLDISYAWTDLNGYSAPCRYTRTPTMLFYEKRPSKGETEVQKTFDRSTSEFRALYSYGESKSGQIANDQIRVNAPMDIALYHIQDKYLRDVIATARVIGLEEVEGQPCWRLESDQLAAGYYVVWLDPNVSFCPRRVKVAWQTAAVERVIDFEEYKEIAEGAWFAQKIHEVVSKAGKPVTDMYAIAESVSAKDIRDIPAITFGPGIPVKNSGLRRWVN